MRSSPPERFPVVGLKGRIKTVPEDFLVREILRYEPEGTGQYVYLLIRKTGRNSHEVSRDLARIFNVSERSVNFAGWKDRNAVTEQYFSVLCRDELKPVVEKEIGELPGIELLQVSRGEGALKSAFIEKNEFEIILRDVEGTCEIDEIRKAMECLSLWGVPNFYGEQRFGENSRNLEIARKYIDGERVPAMNRKVFRLCLSAYQSAVFNSALERRIAAGGFYKLFEGDILVDHRTEGFKRVTDPEEWLTRYEEQTVSQTAPIPGAGTELATGYPGTWEEEAYREYGLDETKLERFRRVRFFGTRRAIRFFPEAMSVEQKRTDLVFRFRLPRGSYATTLLNALGV